MQTTKLDKTAKRHRQNAEHLCELQYVRYQSFIELGLKALGVKYIMTKTGKEAWEKLQALSDEAQAQGKKVTDKVAVIVTDLEMPEMDGFTLTRLVKQDPRFKTIPVVIHSSLTGTTNENHVKAVGADAYVAKFSPRELAGCIRSVLKP